MEGGDRIKVLYLIDELLSGGTENQLILLAENLDPERFEPIIGVLRENSFQEESVKRTPVVTFAQAKGSLGNRLGALRSIRSFLIRERIDILQTHFVDSEILGILARVGLRGKPRIIGTRRNLYHWIPREPRSFHVYRFLSRWVDHILANSYAAREKCMELEGAPPEKISVIHNAVDMGRFEALDSALARAKLGIEIGDVAIGAIANWRPVKGLAVFLEAAASVKRQCPKARFVLAGCGQQRSELEQLAKHLRIRDRVLFLESYPDILQVIAALDIAVQPSFSESFSNVWLEYLAAGKPVVATRVGDAERVFRHEVNGLLVQPGSPSAMADAILSLWHSPELSFAMGCAGRADVRVKWSMETCLANYSALYDDLCGRRFDHTNQ